MKKHLLSFLFIAISFVASSQITLTVTATNVSCFGGATGSATVTPTGGIAPYTYSLTAPPQSNGTGAFSGLLAGTYTVIVNDAMTTTNSITFTITESTALVATTTATNELCQGTASGAIDVVVSGGTPPYLYNIAGGPYVSTSLFPNQPAGVQVVSVKDANNCITTQTAVVIPTTAFSASVTSINNVSCFGINDGSATASPIGGIGGPYSYSWTPSGQSSLTAINLSPGTHTVTITNFGGCTATTTVNITQPSPLTAIVNANNVRCFGTNTGTVSVAGTGGNAPYSYLWTSPLTSTLATVSNVGIGVYFVDITDANGCSITQTVAVTQPTQLMATASATSANCGQSDGAICANVTGGTVGPYTFLWSNLSTTQCLSLVPAGIYTVTVTDANLCTFSFAGLVNSVGGPTVSISSQTNNICFGLCNGAAIASANGGTTPYMYSWNSGQVTSTATNLCASIYNVTVTDATGCIGTASVNITQPVMPLTAFINGSNTTCFGACNGSASVVSTGGVGAINYTWNTAPPQNGQTINSICPGNWTCIVTDQNGCTAAASVTIGSSQTFSTNITQIIGTCGTTCNGSAKINTIGGNAPYTISSTGPLNINTFNPTNLCAGIYTVTATDINGCSFMNMLTINSLGSNTITNVTAITTSYDETCLQTSDGAIDLTITGSNPGPFTYLWNNGATAQDLNNISSNNYWVTILDGSSNCLVLRDTVNAIGTNCGTISGNVFIDNNSDCIKNAGDNNSNNTQIIANPGNRIGYTNFNGDYIFYNLPFATYTITSSTTANMLATCVTTLNTTLNSVTPNSINNNFAKEYIPITQPDIYVSAWSQGIVPGFVCRVNYLVYNYNTFNANGIFKATLPSAFIPNITNAFPAAYTLSGDTIIWNFANISYTGWYPNFYVDFTTPLSTQLGSTFTSCMWAQPTVTDLNYVNNTTCYQRLVTGSFDPNDKTVSPVGVGANGDIAATETDLTYLIRFQNTGNGPAVNIYVKDTLSPNVDINTFEMLGSSHNYMIDVLPGNILRWKFNNIMLPDSNSNEPASHGYIQYRIKRTNNNTPGTQIKNTAYIYFDFNEPVVTNTAINTIETITGIKSSYNTNDEWNVYPNPSTGALYIVNSSSVKEESQIQVINSIGQTVLEETITSNYKNVDLSKLNNGVYFVKILSDKHNVIKRVVLSK